MSAPRVCGHLIATRGTTAMHCALPRGHDGSCRPAGWSPPTPAPPPARAAVTDADVSALLDRVVALLLTIKHDAEWPERRGGGVRHEFRAYRAEADTLIQELRPDIAARTGEVTEYLVRSADRAAHAPNAPADAGRAGLDLDAIWERANAATSAPWYPHTLKIGEHVGYWVSHRPSECVALVNGPAVMMPNTAANAEFIAHARTDVPMLAVRVRELEMELDVARAERRGLRAELDTLNALTPPLMAEMREDAARLSDMEARAIAAEAALNAQRALNGARATRLARPAGGDADA